MSQPPKNKEEANGDVDTLAIPLEAEEKLEKETQETIKPIDHPPPQPVLEDNTTHITDKLLITHQKKPEEVNKIIEIVKGDTKVDGTKNKNFYSNFKSHRQYKEGDYENFSVSTEKVNNSLMDIGLFERGELKILRNMTRIDPTPSFFNYLNSNTLNDQNIEAKECFKMVKNLSENLDSNGIRASFVHSSFSSTNECNIYLAFVNFAGKVLIYVGQSTHSIAKRWCGTKSDDIPFPSHVDVAYLFDKKVKKMFVDSVLSLVRPEDVVIVGLNLTDDFIDNVANLFPIGEIEGKISALRSSKKDKPELYYSFMLNVIEYYLMRKWQTHKQLNQKYELRCGKHGTITLTPNIDITGAF